jgi:RNA polymerase subunit RPABC4/transcription elongation factor Spt4
MFDPHALPVPDLGLGCRKCGYPLASLTEHRCPECGRAFTLEEYIPSGATPLLIAGGQQVRATNDIINLLRIYQIPFVERPGPFEAVLGSLRLTREDISPPIAVPRDQYLEAIDLIRRHWLDEPMPDPPLGAGQPDAAGRQSDWACPHCGETNPPNFEVCWNCETPAHATEPP